MKYKILEGRNSDPNKAIEELEKKVNSSLAKGWKLQGGASITCTDYQWYTVLQAMVKD